MEPFGEHSRKIQIFSHSNITFPQMSPSPSEFVCVCVCVSGSLSLQAKWTQNILFTILPAGQQCIHSFPVDPNSGKSHWFTRYTFLSASKLVTPSFRSFVEVRETHKHTRQYLYLFLNSKGHKVQKLDFPFGWTLLRAPDHWMFRNDIFIGFVCHHLTCVS